MTMTKEVVSDATATTITPPSPTCCHRVVVVLARGKGRLDAAPLRRGLMREPKRFDGVSMVIKRRNTATTRTFRGHCTAGGGPQAPEGGDPRLRNGGGEGLPRGWTTKAQGIMMNNRMIRHMIRRRPTIAPVVLVHRSSKPSSTVGWPTGRAPPRQIR